MYKRLLVLFLVATLCACGGGDSSSNGPASISVDRNFISIESTTSDYPGEVVKVTLSNIPDDGVYTKTFIRDEDREISGAYFDLTSKKTADLEIAFLDSYIAGKGTFENQVALVVCLDAECNDQVEGSPVVIDTLMVSDPARGVTVSIEQSYITVVGSTVEGLEPGNIAVAPETTIIPINIDGLAAADTYVRVLESTYYPTISSEWLSKSGNKNFLEVRYEAPDVFSHGDHEITYTLDVCATGGYDRLLCTYPIEGSPIEITINYEINKIPAGTVSIEPDRRKALEHNIIDSESSKLLNLLAVVSTEPENTLIMYHLDDLASSETIALDSPPTSVNFANNGNSKKVFVGHETGITALEYDKENTSFSSKNFIETNTDVYDLVATDSAVYWLEKDSYSGFYKTDLETNVTTSAIGQYSQQEYTLRGGREKTVRLHPNFETAYVAARSNLQVIGLKGNPPSQEYDYRSADDTAFRCHNIWLSGDGEKVYSRCSHVSTTYDSLTNSASGLGNIPLLTMTENYFTPVIMSLSESVENELAVIENNNEISALKCENSITDDDPIDDTCFFVLSLFTKDTLEVISAYPFDKVMVDDVSYKEIPEFVAFNNDGSTAFVLTSLDGPSSPKSYLLEFDR